MTGFLLDTNVISEVTRPHPSQAVLDWLAAVEQQTVFLSAATLAELSYGLERLPHGQRRKRLSDWLFGELPIRFDRRILAVDEAVAHAWGQLMHRAQASGRPMAVIDGFLAATALVHDLTLVTRNETDFRAVSKGIVNPWVS